jgi:transposase-like protein
MALLCYRRHRFPPECHPVRDLALSPLHPELPRCRGIAAERGPDISYETVRRWVLKFGPAIARRLRQYRPRPSDCWHLDEMVVRIAGERMYLCVLWTTRGRS